jgi:hypothetical protein
MCPNVCSKEHAVTTARQFSKTWPTPKVVNNLKHLRLCGSNTVIDPVLSLDQAKESVKNTKRY